MMSAIPEEVATRLMIRAKRTMWGYLGIAAVLALPTRGIALLLVPWAFMQLVMAVWLISHGRLTTATLRDEPADEAATPAEPPADFKARLLVHLKRAWHASVLMLSRIIPLVVVECEFELGGVTQRAYKLMFSNEWVNVDDQGRAQLLVNPSWPGAHSWLVSHIPLDDRSLLPTDLSGRSYGGTGRSATSTSLRFRDAA